MALQRLLLLCMSERGQRQKEAPKIHQFLVEDDVEDITCV